MADDQGIQEQAPDAPPPFLADKPQLSDVMSPQPIGGAKTPDQSDTAGVVYSDMPGPQQAPQAQVQPAADIQTQPGRQYSSPGPTTYTPQQQPQGYWDARRGSNQPDYRGSVSPDRPANRVPGPDLWSNRWMRFFTAWREGTPGLVNLQKLSEGNLALESHRQAYDDAYKNRSDLNAAVEGINGEFDRMNGTIEGAVGEHDHGPGVPGGGPTNTAPQQGGVAGIPGGGGGGSGAPAGGAQMTVPPEYRRAQAIANAQDEAIKRSILNMATNGDPAMQRFGAQMWNSWRTGELDRAKLGLQMEMFREGLKAAQQPGTQLPWEGQAPGQPSAGQLPPTPQTSQQAPQQAPNAAAPDVPPPPSGGEEPQQQQPTIQPAIMTTPQAAAPMYQQRPSPPPMPPGPTAGTAAPERPGPQQVAQQQPAPAPPTAPRGAAPEGAAPGQPPQLKTGMEYAEGMMDQRARAMGYTPQQYVQTLLEAARKADDRAQQLSFLNPRMATSETNRALGFRQEAQRVQEAIKLGLEKLYGPGQKGAEESAAIEAKRHYELGEQTPERPGVAAIEPPSSAPGGTRYTGVTHLPQSDMPAMPDNVPGAAHAKQQTEKLDEDFSKRSDGANDSQLQLNLMKQHLAGMPRTGPFAPGVRATHVYEWAKSANDLINRFNLIGVTGADGQPISIVDPTKIADYDAANKVTNNLGAAMTRTLGQREAAQVVRMAIKSQPAATLPAESSALVTYGLQAANKYNLDKKAAFDDWVSRNGNYNSTGFVESFRRNNPVEMYADYAETLYKAWKKMGDPASAGYAQRKAEVFKMLREHHIDPSDL